LSAKICLFRTTMPYSFCNTVLS